MMGFLRIAATTVFLCVGCLASNGLSYNDMLTLPRLGGVAYSPSGLTGVFSLTEYDSDYELERAGLWAFSVDSGSDPPVQITNVPGDGNPVFLDEGTLAFVRDGSIYAMDMSGGVASGGNSTVQVTDFPLPLGNLKMAGQYLVFSIELFPNSSMQETASRDAARAADKSTAMAFDHLMVRHWDTWFEGKYNHLHVLHLQKTWRDLIPFGPAAAVDLMPGMAADSPQKPFGGTEDFDVTASGLVAFAAQVGPDFAWSTDVNIYLIDAATAAAGRRRSIRGGWGDAAAAPAPRCFTCDNKASDLSPVFSPGGRSLVFGRREEPVFEADRVRLALYDLDSATTTVLTEGWDRSVQGTVWSAKPTGERTVYVTAAELGRVKVFEVAVDAHSGDPSLDVRLIANEHSVSGLALLGGGGRGLAFRRSSFYAPNEAFVLRDLPSDNLGMLQAEQGQGGVVAPSPPEALTSMSAAGLSGLDLPEAEEFWFQGGGSDAVMGWLIRPSGFDPTRKYPLALLIHGGPQGAWSDAWSTRWNPQVYAGAGYVTVAINPQGSTGYGQSFTNAVSGDWGGAPFESLMRGVDHVLETYDFIDQENLFALGASYGGYMINWILGHDQRFNALVTHDGIFSNKMAYYTTEELWFPEHEFGGTPWDPDALDLMEKWDPSRFVDRWATPTLVVQGSKDYRLEEGMGISVFTALQRRGVPSRLLVFPDENHWVLRPANSARWHQEVLAWLHKHTK